MARSRAGTITSTGSGEAPIDYYSHAAGDHKEDLWDEDVQVHQAGYLTDLLGNRAVDVINGYAKSDRPFFASVHFNAPHWPWEAPGDEAESERLTRKSLADFDGGSQKTYQRMVQSMDVQVGRILQALDARGLTENTIVIFTSDNGGERFSDTWPFTGRKTELLEGGLRIPSVISWPGRIPSGATTDQVSMTMDWMPTLLAAAGVPPDQAFASDGIDLLPVLTKGTPPRSAEVVLALQSQRAAGSAGRRLQVPEDSRQHLSVQSRGRPDGARQPQGAAARTMYDRLAAAVARMERDDAPGDRRELHRELQR